MDLSGNSIPPLQPPPLTPTSLSQEKLYIRTPPLSSSPPKFLPTPYRNCWLNQRCWDGFWGMSLPSAQVANIWNKPLSLSPAPVSWVWLSLWQAVETTGTFFPVSLSLEYEQLYRSVFSKFSTMHMHYFWNQMYKGFYIFLRSKVYRNLN